MAWTEKQNPTTSWTSAGSLSATFSPMAGVGSHTWYEGVMISGPFGHGSLGHTPFGRAHRFTKLDTPTTTWGTV